MKDSPLPSNQNASRRILVVDDDSVCRWVSTEVLSRSGFQVETAMDGAAAWEALSASAYDLLITDHNMPKITGVELLKKVRGARMGLPVVMISSMMPLDELNRVPELLPTAFLSKPFTGEELLGLVEKILPP